MLNKDEIIKIVKDKPVHAGIAGVAAFIILILLLSLLFGGGNSDKKASSFKVKKGPLRISVIETGTIQAKEKIIVKNEVEGTTSIIYIIDEGTKVKKGDLLVELDSSSLLDQKVDQEISVQNAEASFISAREDLAVTKNQAQSDIDSAQLTYDFAVQDLDKYIKGEYPNQLKEAESKITLAEEEYTRAKDDLDWSKRLYDEKYLSQTELRADELSEKQKKLDLELSQNELDLLKNFTHKREIIQLESDVKQAKMALERATRKAKADVVQAEANLKAKEAEFNRQQDKLKKIENQLEKTKIYAPADGLALYATSTDRGPGRFGRSEEPLDEGSSVRERQELIHLPTTSGFNAEIGIYESDLDKVRAGLPVIITIDRLPGERFLGKVKSVSPVADAMSSFLNPDLKLYDTVIEIDNADNIDLLKSGMSCNTEIIVEQHKEALYIPVQAVIRVDGKPTVFIVDGNDLEPRPVEIGLDNNTMIRIIKGLEEDEVVSLTPPLDQAATLENTNTILEDITIDPIPESQGNSKAAGGNGLPSGSGGQTGNMPGFTKDSFIKMMDQDGDGKVAESEFRGPADRFKDSDKNGDGFITLDEVPDFSQMRGPGQGDFGGQQGGMTSDGMSNMPRPTKDSFIKMMDQDGDGKVSESEFRGPSNMFGSMDKNGDGYITIDEIPDFSQMRGTGQGGFGGQQGGMPDGAGGFPSGGSR